MSKFLLSEVKELPFDFPGAVSAYIAALVAHQKSEGEPAPVAPHPMVEASVRRVQYPVVAKRADDFVPDYEIIDDTPPAPTFTERKQILVNQTVAMFNAASSTIIPPLKRNLWQMQYEDVLSIKEDERTDGNKSVIKKYEQRLAKEKNLHRHLAELHAEIDDLTEDTIDAWQPAPFPT